MDASEGLREYRRRAAAAVLGGAFVFLVGGFLIEPLGGIAGAMIGLGALATGCGIAGLIRVVRIRRLVSSSGWRQRRARFRVVGGGNGQPALLLASDDKEPEAVVSVSTTVWRWGALDGTETLWVTGNPLSRFAAVATPDGAHVIVVKRPILPWWRGRLRRIAASI